MQAHLSISAFRRCWEATYGADASDDMEEAVGQVGSRKGKSNQTSPCRIA